MKDSSQCKTSKKTVKIFFQRFSLFNPYLISSEEKMICTQDCNLSLILYHLIKLIQFTANISQLCKSRDKNKPLTVTVVQRHCYLLTSDSHQKQETSNFITCFHFNRNLLLNFSCTAPLPTKLRCSGFQTFFFPLQS